MRLAGRGLEDQLRMSFGEVLRVRVDGRTFHFTNEEDNSGVRLQRLSSSSEVAQAELVAQDIWVCELLVYFEVLHLEREVISVGH